MTGGRFGGLRWPAAANRAYAGDNREARIVGLVDYTPIALNNDADSDRQAGNFVDRPREHRHMISLTAVF